MRRVFVQETADAEAVYMLQRATGPAGGRPRGARPDYLLWTRFRYLDPVWRDEAGGTRAFTVPRVVGEFRTDLASVPGPFTWLVPRDGSHTPAAILHDALVRGADADGGVFYEGPPVTREEADTVFRQAMAHLEVPFLRRWLMWAAVSMATLWSCAGHVRRWWWRAVIAVSVVVLGGGAVLGSLDLFDVGDGLRWDVAGRQLRLGLPGMPQDDLLTEALWLLGVSLLGVAVGVLPWGTRWRTGLVAGLALVFLGFPLAVSGIAYLGYNLVELALYGLLRLRRALRPAADEPVTPPPLARALPD